MEGEFAGSHTPSQWSPDGSLIVFTSYKNTLAPNTPERNSQRLQDIYIVRPDGSGLQRLTNDTALPLGTSDPGDFGAAFPAWTRDGRITFTRFPMPPEPEFELWIMDADGSDAQRLHPSDAATLTALACVSCTYPGLTDLDVPNFAYWIPGP
jgi:Tol biopolymer transport system component